MWNTKSFRCLSLNFSNGHKMAQGSEEDGNWIPGEKGFPNCLEQLLSECLE